MPIRILPQEVISRIAAGEVIERPASVVKELVENSIDAGALAISIEIRDGGLSLIRVADNGSGIPREDAPLLLERFATSKISSPEDLQAIRTLGFRGEALASIAAVSKVEILTRAKGEEVGTRIRAEDGVKTIETAASPQGTQVTVRNLFYNLPARRKFLKSHFREAELVRTTVIRYALSYPHIAFRFTVDGKERFLAPSARPLERIAQALGRDVASEMVGIDWEGGDIKVKGFISRPALGKSGRDWQFFFINGRPVRAGLLAVVLERPYTGKIAPGRRPVAVIWIEVNPSFVDVNIHPRKAEVRLAQERAVYYALGKAVEEALSAFPHREECAPVAWPFEGVSYLPAVKEVREEYFTPSFSILGQVDYTYILAWSSEGLMVVDQHAAHEQVLFEKILEGKERYPLEPPSYLELPLPEAELLEERLGILQELGLEAEPFGRGAFVIRAAPFPLSSTLLPELMEKIVEEIRETSRLSEEEVRERLALRMACLAAVKKGDILTAERMQEIVNEFFNSWSPSTCPHGRPAFFLLSREEIERRFLRGR
ncbi:MAG: DNA mismatch repair endonuclease MutL [Anaerolineae bacterium]|nr:DNA mismatch repair endonuclease MutL [Anaerolineae bacterium]